MKVIRFGVIDKDFVYMEEFRKWEDVVFWIKYLGVLVCVLRFFFNWVEWVIVF